MKQETIDRYNEIVQMLDKGIPVSDVCTILDVSSRTVGRAKEYVNGGVSKPVVKTAPLEPMKKVAETDRSPIQYLHVANQINIITGDKIATYDSSSEDFDKLAKALQSEDWATARGIIYKPEKVAAWISESKDVQFKGGILYYKGYRYTSTFVKRIVAAFEAGKTPDHLLKFFENLVQNPNKCSVDQTFDFLKANNLPITEDGHFLAFKAVRKDFKDLHTGTMDNSVGKVVEMPRNLVQFDPNVTCSSGLHFCARGYLTHFSTENIVIVKINPRDVVSIPTDYKQMKGRCCRYEVIKQVDSNYRLPAFVD